MTKIEFFFFYRFDAALAMGAGGQRLKRLQEKASSQQRRPLLRLR